jgi:2-(1,2-epoxy-1,2-dihydrophenyl)acetyl-CoA isomerase
MTYDLDTETTDLLAQVDGHLGVITFNRPDRRNALSDAMYAGFAKVLPMLAADDEVRVVMITGNGGAFCAGGDVKGMHESHQPGAAPRRGATIQSSTDHLRTIQKQVSLAIHRFPKPVIAALPGAAAGAGMSIALACDIRLAAEQAIIVPAFANVGASGDFGGSWFLTRRYGQGKRALLHLAPTLGSRGSRSWDRQPSAGQRRFR